ncbi:MAG: trypsin-like serine protease [Campylobacterota bacterium]|nr:trypsin-like serine protease [Campylobacterota bacterium]
MKSFFILIFSITLSFSNSLDIANKAYIQGDYIKAIKYYNISYDNNLISSKLKLKMCYLKLGDNFKRISNFEKAMFWYKKALELKSSVAKSKISSIYEKQGDQYYKIKKYKQSLALYKKSYKLLHNKKVENKIKKTKKILSHLDSAKNDRREKVVDNSPIWTRSIGRLIIPKELTFISKRKYKTDIGKCSATLISDGSYNKLRVIITASHCLTNYDETAGDLKFIIKNNRGVVDYRRASIYKDSNFNDKKLKTTTDYAILILDTPISKKDVKPMFITKNSFTTLQKNNKKHFSSLAGYSSDIGDFGSALTYDKKCKVWSFDNMYGASDCIGYKGASGGPVVMTTIKNKIERYNFIGVVSHFRNKKYKNIYFTPHHIFYKDIKKAMKKYNKK